MTQNLTQKPRRMKLRFTWLWWSGALTLLTLGGWIGYGRWMNAASQAVGVQMSTVTLGTVEDPITQTGTVKLAQQQTLESLSEGRVEDVYVQEGDRIEAGQTLLLLQDDTWETKRRQHDLEVQKKEIALTQQRQAIATAELQLQDAQQQLAEDEALFEQDYVSGDDVEQAQRGVREAESALRTAQLQLEQDLLDMQTLALNAQELEQELLSKRIVSPAPAIVLDLMVQRGSVVDTGTKLMILGDPDRELIYLELSPLRAQQVQPNQLARIRPLGPDAETYTGQVKELALLAGNSEQDDQGGQASLEVVVELDTPSGALIPGTQVSVDVVLAQQTDVVKIDAGALQQSEDGPFVWVVGPDGTAQKQSVSIGLEGLTELEITNGLTPEDEIIALSDRPLEEGMAVEVRDQMPPDRAP